MLDNIEKVIYFVSHINTGKVLVIDDSKSFIKEIEIGSRPQNIVTDDLGKVYIACDAQINVIENLNSIIRLNIPSNGNIQVDSVSKKIYVSNTEEIDIYNLEDGKKITSITGFAAADRLQLSIDMKRLFILDILKNEIKTYDVESLDLIDVYNKVGIAPCDFLLSEDKKYLFIANKGLNNRDCGCEITIIDIDTKKKYNVEMQRGSDIKSLEQTGNYLYAANSGLNVIEVINIENKQLLSKIETSLPFVEKIRLSKDKQTLFAISRNDEKMSTIDIIDKDSFVIRETLKFELSRPYDIADMVFYQNENEPLVFMKLI